MRTHLHVLGLALIMSACTSQPAKEEATTAQDAPAMGQPAEEQQPQSQETPPAETPEATPEPVKEEVNPNLKTCVFKSVTEEACAKLVFDCATFDNPVVIGLPKAQMDVWNDLIVFGGEGDFPSANPKYKGKKFLIEFVPTKGPNCATMMSGGTEKSNVFKIVSFQLAK